jgi:hypothetical protein
MTTTTTAPASSVRLLTRLQSLGDTVAPELLADIDAVVNELTTELAFLTFERDTAQQRQGALLLDLSAAWLADRPDPEGSAR